MHRPQRAARDDQHHDARRAGARRRHPGGRCDGGGGEHQPQPAHGQGARAGDSRRRAADRGAGVRLDARDLHRVPADVLPRRRRALPVRAARRSRRLRDARVVLLVADDRPDAGEISPGSTRARQSGAVAEPVRASPAGVRTRLPARPRRLRLAARARPSTAALVFIPLFLAVCVSSAALVPWVGQDFFPATDSGQFILHLRAKTGTRIEETARLCDEVEAFIRRTIPARETDHVLDNIGLPDSPMNFMHSTSGAIGAGDADIMVSLTAGASADGRLHSRAARDAAARVSRRRCSTSCPPTSSPRC